MLLEFCLEKELCVSNTWFRREEKCDVTFTMGENETDIDCVGNESTLMVYAKCEGNPWGVSTWACGSRNRYEENNLVRKTCVERKISLLKDTNIRKRF